MRGAALAWMALLAIGWTVRADELPADIDPSIQQYAPHLKQLLKNELRFAQRVCEPSPEQLRNLEADCLAAFPQLLKKLSEQQQQMQRGRAPKDAADARQLIVASIASAVQNRLPAEAFGRYQSELEKRAAARRHAAVVNIVAQLDRQLVFTADQRAKLVAALDQSWKEDWSSVTEALQFGMDYLPDLPESLVAPVLDAKQKEAWQALPRQGRIQFGLAGLGLVQWIELEARGVNDGEVPP